MLVASSAGGGEFVQDFAEEGFVVVFFAVACVVVGGEIAAWDPCGIGGVGGGGFFDVFG